MDNQGTPGQWKSRMIKDHNLLVKVSKDILLKGNILLNTSQDHGEIQIPIQYWKESTQF